MWRSRRRDRQGTDEDVRVRAQEQRERDRLVQDRLIAGRENQEANEIGATYCFGLIR